MHPLHKEILKEIKDKSGTPTSHTFLDSYLGTRHPRYPVSAPVLRKIAKEWMSRNKDLACAEFTAVLTSLNAGESCTEKCMAGLLLDYAKEPQRKFDIKLFDLWLDNLEGWAEIDSLCTGKYSLAEIPSNFTKWKSFPKKLSKSKAIEKRRASLVFFCSPISHSDNDSLALTALENIDQLKHEKDILITKAISWLLRSMIRYHRPRVESFMLENKDQLPAIAVRETMIKLKTGKKNKTRIVRPRSGRSS
jgi:3-methyladenine DNA glycosylase AlkD